MNLSELLTRAGLPAKPAVANQPVAGVTDDSRSVQSGWIFAAQRGVHVNGHHYVAAALERGALLAIVDEDVPGVDRERLIRVPDARDTLGLLAHAFHGDPSRLMLVIGVSGTNGKTTTTYVLEAILREAGYNPGVIGTIEYRYAGRREKAEHTTPSALLLASLFARMRDAGIDAVAMEVSSHAIDQQRASGIQFDIGIFTNISQDHLDYHGTMEAYAAVKQRFYFDLLLRRKNKLEIRVPTAVFGIDNEYGARFAADFTGRELTFGLDRSADVRAEDIKYSAQGASFIARTSLGDLQINSPLLGQFNVTNVLGAIAAAQAAVIPAQAITAGIESLRPVAGRFEQVDCGQDFSVVVDYAHTPDGLERVLQSARAMTRGRIISVFGCGGDRDPGKRPKMGRIVGDLADHAILTNDNPRTEDPERIAKMALEGLRQSRIDMAEAEVILDRRAAIERAISLARTGDFVLIAGKGHEDYQILNTGTIHFDDREIAGEVLRARVSKQ